MRKRLPRGALLRAAIRNNTRLGVRWVGAPKGRGATAIKRPASESIRAPSNANSEAPYRLCTAGCGRFPNAPNYDTSCKLCPMTGSNEHTNSCNRRQPLDFVPKDLRAEDYDLEVSPKAQSSSSDANPNAKSKPKVWPPALKRSIRAAQATDAPTEQSVPLPKLAVVTPAPQPPPARQRRPYADERQRGPEVKRSKRTP